MFFLSSDLGWNDEESMRFTTDFRRYFSSGYMNRGLSSWTYDTPRILPKEGAKTREFFVFI